LNYLELVEARDAEATAPQTQTLLFRGVF